MKKYLLLSISVLLAGVVNAQVWQGSGITGNNLTGGVYRTGNIGIGTPADPTNPLSIVSNNQNSILLSIPPGGGYMGGPPAYFGNAGIGFFSNPASDPGYSIFRLNAPVANNGFFIQDNNSANVFTSITYNSGRMYFGKNWSSSAYYTNPSNPPYIFTGNVGIPALVLGNPNGAAVIPTGYDLYSLNGIYTPKIAIGNNTGFPVTNVFNVVGNSNFNGNVGIGTTAAPAAKLHVVGDVRVSGNVGIQSSSVLEFGVGLTKEVNAGKIGYGTFVANSLNIVGAGTTGTNRSITFFNEGGATFNGGVNVSGNVGIGGASDVSAKLQVNGDLRLASEYSKMKFGGDIYGYITGDDGTQKKLMVYHPSQVRLTNTAFVSYGQPTKGLVLTGDNTVQIGNLANDGTHIDLRTSSNSNGYGVLEVIKKQGSLVGDLVINPGGGIVSIGSITPPVCASNPLKLYVDGIIGAKEVRVSLTNWCDYVFDETYKLKPLEEVEAFIKTNKHLPEIPSEKEVVENGVGLGDMSKMHMKKIEELTLYMIELKKQNDKLSEEVSSLKALITDK